MVKLLDSGNLQILSNPLEVIWESFKHPTDTFLPGMEMDRNLVLKSWASNDNPAEGKFKFQLEHSQYTIRMERSIYWQSRVSGDFMPDDILPIVSSLLSNSNRSGITYNRTKTTSSSFSKNNTRLVMHFDGTVQYFTRLNESAPWNLTWWKPKNRCDKFRACGNYERCSNSENRSTCECLPGFKSNLPDSSRDFSGNCQRTAPLCDGVAKILNFKPLNVNKVEKPDHFPVSSENECKEVCLKDCNCQAYSIETSQVRGVTRKCWIWSYDLYNIQVEDTNGGREIHLRVQPNISPEPKQTKQDGGPNNINNQFKQWPLAFAVTVASVLALAFAAWRLWQEDKVLDMMDRKLSAGSKTKTNEILKCINVGLLCVQEDPDDRPTMSDVITMLSSVSATLSTPKRPAFIVSRGFNYMASSSSSKAETNNEITITLEGIVEENSKAKTKMETGEVVLFGEIFELRFFTPSNGSNNDPRRYIGIWYDMFDPKTIVWVANRDSPLNHKNGDFGIAKDGNLTVFNEHKNSVWKTYLPVPLKGMEKLLDLETCKF
ncbi:hypothetical protein JRO89_XS01G0157200 [Xanthoceras sorbifolium]|uniref:non-specific serine/threonine protein kinase n=1 Tax=Xanthoceras sorbifolium TaxID=99658 RepID=A0ABQ8IJJ4_9ROSI|nr:hypothetical protein JRO89_XS01G0157200 [Xanthoceras sorbifolium]